MCIIRLRGLQYKILCEDSGVYLFVFVHTRLLMHWLFKTVNQKLPSLAISPFHPLTESQYHKISLHKRNVGYLEK